MSAFYVYNILDAMRYFHRGDEENKQPYVNHIKLSMATNPHEGELLLLSGNMELGEEMDELLSTAYAKKQPSHELKYPGMLYHIINETARRSSVDYVVMDLSPACNKFNRTLLLMSHVFMLPCRASSNSPSLTRS